MSKYDDSPATRINSYSRVTRYCVISGYGSDDCSARIDTPPTVFPLEDPLCDARIEICDETLISGSPFLNVGSLSCSFTPVQVFPLL